MRDKIRTVIRCGLVTAWCVFPLVVGVGSAYGQTPSANVQTDWSKANLADVDQAARAGNSVAEDELGNRYLFGKGGAPKDHAHAMEWFRRAGDQGNTDAELNLGAWYYLGLHDYAQAAVWLRKAADQGDPQAKSLLQIWYSNGGGAPKGDQQIAQHPVAAATSPSAQPSTRPSRIRVGGAVLAGTLISKTMPVYPPVAVSARVQGTVVLDALISRSGTVETVKAVSGPALLLQSAVDAVKTWRYKPYLLNGIPIELESTISVNFVLMPPQTPASQQQPGLNADTDSSAQEAVNEANCHSFPWLQDATVAQLKACAALNNQIAVGQQQAAATIWNTASDAPSLPGLPQEQTGDPVQSSESAADWQQDHQAKIDELTQEIANHEQQAQQDDADAQQAEAQASQNSGISGGYGAIANAVNAGLNAGLAQKDRDNADQERQEAEQEREQLAELGAEQPPEAVNNSEQITLTRMQTGMINNGQTISGALQQQEANLRAAQQQRKAQQQVQANAQQIAQEVANGTLTPQQAMQQIQQAAQQAAQQQAQPNAVSPSNAVSETCPNMQGYADNGVHCNPVKNMNSCIRVVSNKWATYGGTAGGLETLVLSNTCSSTVRLSVWGPTGGTDPGELENVGPGNQYIWSNNQPTWQYQADDGVDCFVDNLRPGCSNIGH